MQRQALIVITIISSILILISTYLMIYLPSTNKKKVNQTSSGELTTPKIGGDFELIDFNNQLFNTKDHRDKLLLIYFGFTYCPDICPAELHKLTQVIKQVNNSNKIQAIFITIDPQRDDKNQLKSYLKSFDNSIIGLTGTEKQIKKVADLFKVYYARDPDNQGKDYLLDHTSFIYLMGTDGRYLNYFPQNLTSQEIIAVINKYLP